MKEKVEVPKVGDTELWCPYCGKMAVIMEEDQFTCRSCGFVAAIGPKEYAKIVAYYKKPAKKEGKE